METAQASDPAKQGTKIRYKSYTIFFPYTAKHRRLLTQALIFIPLIQKLRGINVLLSQLTENIIRIFSNVVDRF